MVERQGFGKIDFIGKGKLKITTKGVDKIIIEQAAPRRKDVRDLPDGLLSSLRPLLRGVMGSNTENDAGYWAEIDSLAIMTPEEAANKLKRAGYSCREVSRLLVMGDSLVSQNLAWGNLTDYQVEAKITEVSENLQQYFGRPKNRKK